MSEHHFYYNTYDVTSQKNDKYALIKHDDIEGVWTFVYFSHSDKTSKSVGYLKIGGGEV